VKSTFFFVNASCVALQRAAGTFAEFPHQGGPTQGADSAQDSVGPRDVWMVVVSLRKKRVGTCQTRRAPLLAAPTSGSVAYAIPLRANPFLALTDSEIGGVPADLSKLTEPSAINKPLFPDKWALGWRLLQRISSWILFDSGIHKLNTAAGPASRRLTAGEAPSGINVQFHPSSKLALSLLPACASTPSRVESRTVQKLFAQGASLCQ